MNIVARLREWAGEYEEGSFDTEASLMIEAADRIEKLEAKREEDFAEIKRAQAIIDDLKLKYERLLCQPSQSFSSGVLAAYAVAKACEEEFRDANASPRGYESHAMEQMEACDEVATRIKSLLASAPPHPRLTERPSAEERPMQTQTAQHTPGPWFHRPSQTFGHNGYVIEWGVGPEGCNLAAVTPDHPAEGQKAGDNEANARLMAAAPELFDALVALVNAGETSIIGSEAREQRADARIRALNALVKATTAPPSV